MLITFKPIILPGGRRKDGTWPVYIRVTFKGASRRIPTTLTCTAEDLTRSSKIKNATVLERGAELCASMRQACEDVPPFTLEGWTVDDVVKHIRETLAADSFRLDFFQWADTYLKGKTPTTRVPYVTALNTLERFLGRRELDVTAITRHLLQEFTDFTDSEPKMHMNLRTGEYFAGSKEKMQGGASARHIAKLSNVFNAAKDRYNDEDSGRILIPRSPFSGLTKKAPASQGQRNLGVELIQRIISAQAPERHIRRALDVFVVSFATMGANLADLWEAKPFEGDVWKYNRKKTRTRRADHAEMQVRIPPELRPFIARLQEGPAGWWLPALHAIAQRDGTKLLNRSLKIWAEREGVETFTLYAARHSWASIARKTGVEKATVDECLCHVGDFALTDIYAERSWELQDAANRRVLDLFQWGLQDGSSERSQQPR